MLFVLIIIFWQLTTSSFLVSSCQGKSFDIEGNFHKSQILFLTEKIIKEKVKT